MCEFFAYTFIIFFNSIFKWKREKECIIGKLTIKNLDVIYLDTIRENQEKIIISYFIMKKKKKKI